jgi:hypothetical protein
VQFRLGYELGTGDLLEDVAAGALEDFKDDFGIAAEVVVDILPLMDVVNGSP